MNTRDVISGARSLVVVCRGAVEFFSRPMFNAHLFNPNNASLMEDPAISDRVHLHPGERGEGPGS